MQGETVGKVSQLHAFLWLFPVSRSKTEFSVPSQLSILPFCVTFPRWLTENRPPALESPCSPPLPSFTPTPTPPTAVTPVLSSLLMKIPGPLTSPPTSRRRIRAKPHSYPRFCERGEDSQTLYFTAVSRVLATREEKNKEVFGV